MLFKHGSRFGSKAGWTAVVVAGLVGTGLLLAGTRQWHSRGTAPTIAPEGKRATARERAQVAASYGNLPLSFEPNQGQTDPEVKFLTRNSRYELFLTANEAVFTLPMSEPAKETLASPSVNSARRHHHAETALRLKMRGANRRPNVLGDAQLASRTNYFIGRDPSRWTRNVPQFAHVKYRDIYPGIDLTFYGQQRQIEFDFIVKPGANPAAIALGIEGATKIATDEAGDLLMTSAAGDVRLHKPVAYQKQGEQRQPVDTRFVVKGKEVALAVGGYDRSRELVIDPTVTYSTYKGGTGEDQASSVAVDSTGNAYITGEAGNSIFPHTAGTFAGGLHDAFLVKLDPTGAQVYATLFGGSGDDSGNGIALDGNNGVYVAGATSSPNFPGVTGKFQTTLTGTLNAFVAKLDTTAGSLTFATYLGGSSVDTAAGVAADSTGQVYVVGQTQSTNFPTQNAFQTTFGGNVDAFVTVLNPTFTTPLAYSTYLGGTGIDNGAGIALDSNKKIYVVGNTTGSFPVTGGVFQGALGGGNDAFVAKVDPTLSGAVSLVYSTYLGGSGNETAYSIAVDPATGLAYVTGSTTSANFPLHGAAFGTLQGTQDAFVTEFNAIGTALTFSTYLGGTGSEVGVAIALDGSKNVYVTGQTDSSTGFPTMAPTQAALGGGKDAFVSEFNPAGSALLFSTYLGGSGDEDVVGTGVLGGIAVDSSNNIVVVGDTNSTNFPTVSPLQSANGGGVDAFVTKYAPTSTPASFTVSAGALSSTTITRGSSATSTITVTSVGGFTGAVALTCAVAPATSTPPGCALNPTSVTLAANGSQTSTLTLSTIKPSVVHGTGVSALWLPMPGLLLLGIGLGTKRPAKRKLRALCFGALAVLGLLFLASCGSGNGTGGGTTNPGTTTGGYTVTVSGSGGGTNASSSAVNFTVQ